jgi:hypothetical protein
VKAKCGILFLVDLNVGGSLDLARRELRIRAGGVTGTQGKRPSGYIRAELAFRAPAMS